ncbi:unnamed protein product [Orchesella dallaii]|uniref:Uncharacterized protein n=1 Tax=Orchesella dallaii TaxID=48710 RepID=A0ABP1R2R5_9HEXA
MGKSWSVIRMQRILRRIKQQRVRARGRGMQMPQRPNSIQRFEEVKGNFSSPHHYVDGNNLLGSSMSRINQRREAEQGSPENFVSSSTDYLYYEKDVDLLENLDDDRLENSNDKLILSDSSVTSTSSDDSFLNMSPPRTPGSSSLASTLSDDFFFNLSPRRTIGLCSSSASSAFIPEDSYFLPISPLTSSSDELSDHDLDALPLTPDIHYDNDDSSDDDEHW